MSRYESRAAAGDSYRPRHSTRYSPEPLPRSNGGYDLDQQQQQQQQQQPPMGLNASYYRDTAEALGLPLTPNGTQPRSQPHPSSELVRVPSHQSANSRSSSASSYRECGFRGDDRGRSRAGSRTPDPLERARGIVQDSFSQTSTGIGAGLLGAVVGGIVANRASEAALKQRRGTSSHDRRNGDEATPRLLTVLGAVAGGLGANAVARKVECDRERHRQRMWEGRYGSDDDLGRYESSRRTDVDRQGRLLHDADADDYVYDVERRFSRSRRRHHYVE
ncbi:hypothetical protein HRG_000964 [Hirsutella rhossiliensis]|uniref:Uncharacterized protein n=1 Tax=Hirsutella rhossiliensis TaxID=111463 RepID=A0A9P8NBW6_9HYPO|nr:uncharacterized protein HRG_00964 [Hirsutella rhossiliensis]KAH0968322.1 hypothetical protein HRG_00964 [Hirsutella rhossiliensis]